VFNHNGREQASRFKKSHYGFPSAGNKFGQAFAKALTTEAPFKFMQPMSQPYVFRADLTNDPDFSEDYYLIYQHSDNVIHFASNTEMHGRFMDCTNLVSMSPAITAAFLLARPPRPTTDLALLLPIVRTC
jgi:hypothetical protein